MNEIALRKNIKNNIKGLGYKTTSLLLKMCGAEYLVLVDSWMAEMLYFHGYPFKIPKKKVERIRWGTTDIKDRKKMD